VVTNQPDWVVEVGANIGAFLMDVARRPNVSLLGFEPSQACVNATEQTMLRNSRGNCRIFPQLVGETTRLVAFDFGRHNGSASVLTSASAASQVEQTRLGDSAAVMKIPTWWWAKEFIRLVRPLIVLEYNFVSKRKVDLRDIEALWATATTFANCARMDSWIRRRTMHGTVSLCRWCLCLRRFRGI